MPAQDRVGVDDEPDIDQIIRSRKQSITSQSAAPRNRHPLPDPRSRRARSLQRPRKTVLSWSRASRCGVEQSTSSCSANSFTLTTPATPTRFCVRCSPLLTAAVRADVRAPDPDPEPEELESNPETSP
jgi:hypothetical protein